MCHMPPNQDGTILKLQCCPWALIYSPAVQAVQEAYKWFDKNQLLVKYPNPSVALVKAIGDYDNGYNRGLNARFEKERQQSKSKNGNG